MSCSKIIFCIWVYPDIPGYSLHMPYYRIFQPRVIFLSPPCPSPSSPAPPLRWRKDETHQKVLSPKNVSLNPNHRWHYDTPESGDTHRWMTQKQSTSLGRVVALCECGPPVTLCGEFRTVMKREVTVSAFLAFGSGDPKGGEQVQCSSIETCSF